MTALKPEPVEPTDTMCVTLRLANRRGLRTTAGKANNATSRTAAIDHVAQPIDEAAAATGQAPRFVAFQASRDGLHHQEAARRLATRTEVVTPTVLNVLTGASPTRSAKQPQDPYTARLGDLIVDSIYCRRASVGERSASAELSLRLQQDRLDGVEESG